MAGKEGAMLVDDGIEGLQSCGNVLSRGVIANHITLCDAHGRCMVRQPGGEISTQIISPSVMGTGNVWLSSQEERSRDDSLVRWRVLPGGELNARSAG